jgi:hypothetical protein
MSATLAAEAGRTPQLTITTPETWPPEVFGEHAGRRMRELLVELGFDLFTCEGAEVPDPHQVIVRGQARWAGRPAGRRRCASATTRSTRRWPALRSARNRFAPSSRACCSPAASRALSARGWSADTRSGLRCSPTGHARLSRRSSPRTSMICWTRDAFHRGERSTARSHGPANVVPSLDPVDGWQGTVTQAITEAAPTSPSATSGTRWRAWAAAAYPARRMRR